eukprot:CAMPEP_0115688016 /NCGR_PEP_ID=MMETSP0272-20121206/60783_1 /TAXON_ID=71861 /ORGANISM="Scrippsiella trochoidea, Strain CCMP3099" /LENGTH=81 /DNA_ID=CAMNT_0003127671 /DNA_START=402 /DNA_END=647 /DNA_ORIENTATION=+
MCNLHPGDIRSRDPQSHKACRGPHGDPPSRRTGSPAHVLREAQREPPTTSRPWVAQSPPAQTTSPQTSPSGARWPGGRLLA